MSCPCLHHGHQHTPSPSPSPTIAHRLPASLLEIECWRCSASHGISWLDQSPSSPPDSSCHKTNLATPPSRNPERANSQYYPQYSHPPLNPLGLSTKVRTILYREVVSTLNTHPLLLSLLSLLSRQVKVYFAPATPHILLIFLFPPPSSLSSLNSHTSIFSSSAPPPPISVSSPPHCAPSSSSSSSFP